MAPPSWLISSPLRSGSRRSDTLVRPSPRGTEINQRADVLQARGMPIAEAGRLCQEVDAGYAARSETENS